MKYWTESSCTMKLYGNFTSEAIKTMKWAMFGTFNMESMKRTTCVELDALNRNRVILISFTTVSTKIWHSTENCSESKLAVLILNLWRHGSFNTEFLKIEMLLNEYCYKLKLMPGGFNIEFMKTMKYETKHVPRILNHGSKMNFNTDWGLTFQTECHC